MKILFKNATIVSMKDENYFIGNLLVENNKIIYLGKELPAGDFDRLIECHENIIMPGLKNAHTHSAMSFLKGYANNLPLEQWLFDKILPLEAKLQDGDYYWLNKLSLLEYISSGITACFDMYFNPNELKEASEDYGFRSVLLMLPSSKEGTIAFIENERKKHNELVTYQLGFHSVYTMSEEELIAVSKKAYALHMPIYAHLCETKTEVANCFNEHKLSPVQYAASLGLFRYGGGGYHLVHTDDKDIEIMKKYNISVISCPGSNIKLGSGIAPLKKYYDNGILVALGTDGSASNDSLDLFYEMRLAASLENAIDHNPVGIPAYEIVKMATVNASKVMHLTDADVLGVGKCADLIMLDVSHPNLIPHANLFSSIVYSASKEDVVLTMINGKIVYENGLYFLPEEKEVVYQKCLDIYKRIVK